MLFHEADYFSDISHDLLPDC